MMHRMPFDQLFFWISFALLVPACAPAEEPREDGPRQTAQQPGPREETPRQRSYRLLPVLEPGEAPEADPHFVQGAAGLLAFGKGVKLRSRLILREVGANRVPTAEDLKAIGSLDLSLAEICARNLRNMLRQLIADGGLTAVGSPGEARLLRIDPSHFGVHSLLLIPEFWKQCEHQLGGPAWALAPNRQVFWVLRRDDETALRMSAEDRGLPLFERGTEPILGRYVGREGEELVGGPRFADLTEASREDPDPKKGDK